MEILAVIPARGKSKKIPRKNIVKLAGKPLIVWTIEKAKRSKFITRIIVTTDDKDIASISEKNGAEVPFLRPSYLAEDQVHSIFPVIHTVNWLKKEENYIPDSVVMLLPTSPFRTIKDIDGAIKLHLNSKSATVVGVCQSTKQLEHFRYLQKGNKLKALTKKRNLNVQRQDLEKIYYVNGSVYVSSTKNLLKKKTFHVKNALAYIMDETYCLDINNSTDLSKAKFVIKWQGLK